MEQDLKDQFATFLLNSVSETQVLAAPLQNDDLTNHKIVMVGKDL